MIELHQRGDMGAEIDKYLRANVPEGRDVHFLQALNVGGGVLVFLRELDPTTKRSSSDRK